MTHGVKLSLLLLAGASLAFSASVPAGQPDVQEIVKRSVANNDRNWKAAPRYMYTDREAITRHGTTTVKTYRVTMIEGSPYNELIAVNDEPLPASQRAGEEKKMRQETARRQHESAGARQARIAKYERERHQDHALMGEMVDAFVFERVGEETVNGRRCWVLSAMPKPGYQPKSRETKVLAGMRGKMWVDEQQYQWVKVHAEVFRPVAFGLFIAKVRPGTEFLLQEIPVGGNLWMPSRFVNRVKASVLVFSKNFVDDEKFSDYKPMAKGENETADARR